MRDIRNGNFNFWGQSHKTSVNSLKHLKAQLINNIQEIWNRIKLNYSLNKSIYFLFNLTADILLKILISCLIAGKMFNIFLDFPKSAQLILFWIFSCLFNALESVYHVPCLICLKCENITTKINLKLVVINKLEKKSLHWKSLMIVYYSLSKYTLISSSSNQNQSQINCYPSNQNI